VLELPHVLRPLLLVLWRTEAFLGEECVVGVVEVHPNCKDLAHVFLSADGVLAQEGEGAVLHEVAREDRLS
jgi:hypothetical protein